MGTKNKINFAWLDQMFTTTTLPETFKETV